MSALDNIKIDGNGTGAQKEIVYMKAKTDFPFNVSKEVVITHAHPARSMFKGKALFCMSRDGETGRRRSLEGEWSEDDINCRKCEYTKRVVKDDIELKCNYQCKIYFENEDSEKENVIGVPYSAQKNLSVYAKELVSAGLDTPIVLTKMTRIEDPETGWSTYVFELIRELELIMSEEEAACVNDIREKVKSGGDEMSNELAVSVLMSFEKLDGISEGRAKQIADHICVDGIVKV